MTFFPISVADSNQNFSVFFSLWTFTKKKKKFCILLPNKTLLALYFS